MSGGNDLSGVIKTSFQSATTEAGALTSKVTQLTTATKAHNAEAIKTHEHTKAIREEFAKTKEEAHELGEKFHGIAAAGRMLGGPLGEIVQHLGHMGKAGAEGGMMLGRLITYAGLAGLAFEAYNKVMEATVERQKMLIESEGKVRNAMEQSEKAEHQSGMEGMKGADTYGKLLEANPNGVNEAKYVQKTNHIDAEEARAAVLESYKIKDEKTRQNALLVAGQVRMAGGNFGQAVQEIASDPWMQGDIRSAKWGDIQNLAAKVQQKQTTGSEYGYSVDKLHASQSARADDEYLKRVDDANDLKAKITEAQEDKTREGGAEADLRAALAETISPLTAAMVEVSKKWSMQVDALERIAKAAGMFGYYSGAQSGWRNAAKYGGPDSFDATRTAPKVSGEDR